MADGAMTMGDARANDGAIPDAVERLFGAKAIADLMANPGLPNAVRAGALSSIRNYDGNWLRNRVMNDRGRVMTGLLFLDLHFTESQGAGVTAARIRQEVVRYGLTSAGRVNAFLAASRFANYLKSVPTADGQRLIPLDPFLALHRERWRGMFGAIAHVEPEKARIAVSLPDSVFFGPCTHTLAECFRQGLRLFEVSPEIRHLFERDAGLVLVLSLQTLEDDAAVSVAELARRFSVSRAHVTTVLQEACGTGLARRVGARGGYGAGPELMTVLKRFYGAIFLSFLKALDSGMPR